MAAKALWTKEIQTGRFKFGVGLLILSAVAAAIPFTYNLLIGLGRYIIT